MSWIPCVSEIDRGDAEHAENVLVQIVQPPRSVQAVQNVFELEPSECSARLCGEIAGDDC
jgi:hypothetical protein